MKGKNRNLVAQSIGLTIRAAVFLTVMYGISPAYAADADPADPSVPKLEEKFFKHSYPKEPLDKRLERIEKMVFGETKTGSDKDRLANLVQAVPNLPSGSASSTSSAPTSTASNPAPSDDGDVPMPPPSKARPPVTAQAPQENVSGTKYPQVSAMEQKLLGKDFAAEPVDQRLARLENKVFGKPSSVTDLSERVDRLKQTTGVDITKQAPLGADWADDDDTFMPPPTARNRTAAPPIASSPGADGRSFSGRDLRNDMDSVFNRSKRSSAGSSDDQDVPFTGSGSTYGRRSSTSSSTGASGAYGFGGSAMSSGGSTGSYGFGGGGAGYQRSSPPQLAYRSAPPAMPEAPSGVGLSQQVSALEQEVFSKTFPKNTLPERVAKLESEIIPKDKIAWQEKPLPERVSHLVSIIPISAPSIVKNQRVAQSADPDFNDDIDGTGSGIPNMPQPAPQRSGGLSKIINSLGSMLGGGGYSSGYGVSGNLQTDPQTGLLMDPMTGNLIDPSSGMVIGRRVVQPNYGYNPYAGGMGGMGGMNSFGNGFSPYGSSYGIGGSGMRFGVGGGRVGGMWP